MLKKSIFIILIIFFVSITLYQCRKVEGPVEPTTPEQPYVPTKANILTDDFETFNTGSYSIGNTIGGQWLVKGQGGGLAIIITTRSFNNIKCIQFTKGASTGDYTGMVSLNTNIVKNTNSKIMFSFYCSSTNGTIPPHALPEIILAKGPSSGTVTNILRIRGNNTNTFTVCTNSGGSWALSKSLPGLIYSLATWYKVDITVDLAARTYTVTVNDTYSWNGVLGFFPSRLYVNYFLIAVNSMGVNTGDIAWFDYLFAYVWK